MPADVPGGRRQGGRIRRGHAGTLNFRFLTRMQRAGCTTARQGGLLVAQDACRQEPVRHRPTRPMGRSKLRPSMKLDTQFGTSIKPDSRTMMQLNSRLPKWGLIILLGVASIAASIIAVPSVWSPFLRAAGWRSSSTNRLSHCHIG